MATKLQVYNNALTVHLGERKLASLSENRKPRRLLDGQWDSGFIDCVLEKGQWNFAIRDVLIDYDADVETEFGFQYAFTVPTDFIRVTAISLDEYFRDPILEYQITSDYIYADTQSIYLRYVSNDANFGSDLTRWPDSFTSYAETELASLICKAMTQDDELVMKLEKKAAKALTEARSRDALNQPTQFPPAGTWVRSRGNRRRWKDNSGSF